MTGKEKAWERIVGVISSIFTGWGVFSVVIRILDAISRGQTLIGLNPYVHYLISPWVQVTLLCCFPFLLRKATTLEYLREKDEGPKIIISRWEEKPPEPKRHKIWIKAAWSTAAIAVIAALCTFFLVRYRLSRRVDQASLTHKTTEAPPVATPLPPKVSPSHKGTIVPAPRELEQIPKDKTVQGGTPSTAAIPSAQPATTPAAIPAPPLPDRVPSIECPPAGKLALGWEIDIPQNSPGTPQPLPFWFMSDLPANDPVRFPKLLANLFTLNNALDTKQSKDVKALFDEAQTLISKSKTIPTAAGPTPIVYTVIQINRTFSNDNEMVRVGYLMKTLAGMDAGDGSEKIVISRFSGDNRRLIPTLDALANSRADVACKNAFNRFVGKP